MKIEQLYSTWCIHFDALIVLWYKKVYVVYLCIISNMDYGYDLDNNNVRYNI